MREDFSKVVTERPRRGSRMRHKDVRRKYASDYDEDVAASKEGMRKPYGFKTKEFSDLIGPLHRFLQSRCGKNWNKVHSEICERLKGRSTQQQHILDHVEQYVETNVDIIDGKPNARSRFGVKGYFWKEFYVDPRDGKLKKAPKTASRWRRKPDHDPNILVVDAANSYECIKGIWYQVWKEEKIVPFQNTDGTWGEYKAVNTGKRTLNGKELKALGLTNMVADDAD